MAIPNLWRTKKQRYSLQADVCSHCNQIMFPPREVCPHCHKATQPAQVVHHPLFVMPAPPVATLVQPVAVAGDD